MGQEESLLPPILTAHSGFPLALLSTPMQTDCIKELCSSPFLVLCNSEGSSFLMPASAMRFLVANEMSVRVTQSESWKKLAQRGLLSLLFLHDPGRSFLDDTAGG